MFKKISEFFHFVVVCGFFATLWLIGAKFFFNLDIIPNIDLNPPPVRNLVAEVAGKLVSGSEEKFSNVYYNYILENEGNILTINFSPKHGSDTPESYIMYKVDSGECTVVNHFISGTNFVQRWDRIRSSKAYDMSELKRLDDSAGLQECSDHLYSVAIHYGLWKMPQKEGGDE